MAARHRPPREHRLPAEELPGVWRRAHYNAFCHLGAGVLNPPRDGVPETTMGVLMEIRDSRQERDIGAYDVRSLEGGRWWTSDVVRSDAWVTSMLCDDPRCPALAALRGRCARGLPPWEARVARSPVYAAGAHRARAERLATRATLALEAGLAPGAFALPHRPGHLTEGTAQAGYVRGSHPSVVLLRLEAGAVEEFIDALGRYGCAAVRPRRLRRFARALRAASTMASIATGLGAG